MQFSQPENEIPKYPGYSGFRHNIKHVCIEVALHRDAHNQVFQLGQGEGPIGIVGPMF